MIETPALEKKFTAANVADAYPASPVQQGLLFHSLYEQGSGVYVTQIVCSLSGLRAELFEEAWQRQRAGYDIDDEEHDKCCDPLVGKNGAQISQGRFSSQRSSNQQPGEWGK